MSRTLRMNLEEEKKDSTNERDFLGTLRMIPKKDRKISIGKKVVSRAPMMELEEKKKGSTRERDVLGALRMDSK